MNVREEISFTQPGMIRLKVPIHATIISFDFDVLQIRSK